MRTRFLSALIGVGIASLVFQLFPDTRVRLTINPSDLYPDCSNVSPVKNYAKTEKEIANNTLAFDPKAP